MSHRAGSSALIRGYGIGALGVVACAAGLAVDPAQGQSLSQAMTNALAGNCADIGPDKGPQLALVCAAGGVGAPDATSGATPSDSSDNAGEDQESRTKKRLEDLRKKKAQNTTPTMSDAVDPSDSSGTFDLGSLSGFFNFDYQNVAKRTTYFTNGFNSNRYGGTAGIDKSFSNLVLGVALSYDHTDATLSGNGGNFGIDSYGGSVYGSVTPMDNMFIDASVGYAHEDNTINRNAAFSIGATQIAVGTAHGTPSADKYHMSVDGGYDFVHENITFGPRVGFAYTNNQIGGFSESGTSGLELAFGNQTFQSLTSSLGAKATMAISTSFGVIVPQISADYIHEFDDNQQTFTAHFVQDLNASPTLLIFQNDQPHRDYIGLGIGAVLGLPHGISSFVNYRALVGDTLKTTQTVTAGIRLEF